MRDEERQEQVSGEKEARRDSERLFFSFFFFNFVFGTKMGTASGNGTANRGGSELTIVGKSIREQGAEETKKWGDGLFQFKSRVEWLETEKQRIEQCKSWVGDASIVQEPKSVQEQRLGWECLG